MIRYQFAALTDKTDCLVLPVFEDELEQITTFGLEKDISSQIKTILLSKDFEGKSLQTTFLYTNNENISRILLLGLGKKNECSIRKIKQSFGKSVVQLQQKKCKNVSFYLSKNVVETLGINKFGTEFVLAVETAHYAFDNHKSKEDTVTRFEKVNLVGPTNASIKQELQKSMEKGQHIASGVELVRHLGNTPPTIMTPTYMAEQAMELAKYPNVSVQVLEKEDVEKLGMGCFLGVARGSIQDPKFIIVEYNGNTSLEKPTVLVGKGITFDSGGLSIKPGDYMPDMKFDMLGAATVLGTIKAAAGLKMQKRIVGIVPSCENMPDGDAFRPDDILTAMNGKTVEIKNTDAEGRLILADALCYAAKYDPEVVIDFATLTGACLVAIGNERSGLFCDNDNIANDLYNSAKNVGEQLWRLPLGEEFSKAMKSLVADIKNLGGVGHPRFGGASTAAAFLQYFTSYPWAHIDLASSYYNDKGKPWIRHGANGFGVQTMIEYLG